MLRIGFYFGVVLAPVGHSSRMIGTSALVNIELVFVAAAGKDREKTTRGHRSSQLAFACAQA